MKQNERNSRKRLNSLILLVAFTAVMLIVSTYAWFSTQKNVTIKGIEGIITVAEGLQLSLDGQTWVNELDLGKFDTTDPLAWKSSEYLADSEATFQKPYVMSTTTTNPEGGGDPVITNVWANNVVPTEFLPVSTYAGTGEGIGKTGLQMYWGENTQGNKIENIQIMPEVPESGYFAFDLFLQNSSATGMNWDTLLLDNTSKIIATKSTAGAQNAVRVAFAVYENSNDDNVRVANTPAPSTIIANAANGKNIKDVAIWEPNADVHMDTIVTSNNNVTWSISDLKNVFGQANPLEAAKAKFSSTSTTGTSQIPTYVLTNLSRGVKDAGGKLPGTSGWTETYADTNSIADVYDWATPAQGLKKQITLQTGTDKNDDDGDGSWELNEGQGVPTAEHTELISILRTEHNNDADSANDHKDATGALSTRFQIAAGQYHRMRIYVWLEGQDVDCTNLASLGQGLKVDVGFSKYGADEEPES